MKQHYFTICPVCRQATLYASLTCGNCQTNFSLNASQQLEYTESGDKKVHSPVDQDKLIHLIIRDMADQLKSGEIFLVPVNRFERNRNDIRYHFFPTGRFVLIPISQRKRSTRMEIQATGIVIETEGKQYSVAWDQFFSVTTSGNMVEIRTKDRKVYYFSSPQFSSYFLLKLLEYMIRDFYYPDQIVEFQPRILFQKARDAKNTKTPPHFWDFTGKVPQSPRYTFGPITLFGMGKLLLRPFLNKMMNLTVYNAEILPEKGPYILLVNHQSYIDPFLVLLNIPRKHFPLFLTKSNSFHSKVNRWVLRKFGAIPTRRFETDPAVIRMTIFALKNGYAVGIFPEGERTWTGQFLPFKFGTMRLLHTVREVPVYLAVLKGVFENWPRWLARPSGRRKTSLQFYGPIHLNNFSTVLEIQEYLQEQFRILFHQVE